MSKEAMQQALNMLNEIADDVYCDQRVEEVITALEQALEEKQEPSVDVRAWFTIDEINAWADKKLKENPQWAGQSAQPEQEPVAWRWKERVNGDFDNWVVTSSEPPPYAVEQQPLYTAPPKTEQEQVECMCGICKLGKREWVGLTDEQISDLWCKVSNTDFVTADTHEFARAIEAKLKEKNT